jgi:hypothetical protein
MIDDTTGPKVKMAHLGITHLAFGQAYGLSPTF